MTQETRGRTPRTEAVQTERRTRRMSTITRENNYQLDIFSDEQLDADFEYRWINDTNSRLTQKYNQDWDIVNTSEIKDFQFGQLSSDADTDTRVRKRVGQNADGSPVYTYLMKKPKEFVQEDQAKLFEHARNRTKVMLKGEDGGEHTYASKNNTTELPMVRRGKVN